MSFTVKLNNKKYRFYNIDLLQGIYILILSRYLKNMLDSSSESAVVNRFTSALLYIFCICSIFYFLYKSFTLIHAGKTILSGAFLIVGVPIMTLLFVKLTHFSQSVRNDGSILIFKIFGYFFILSSIKRIITRSEILSPEKNKLIRFVKLQIVKILIKFYKYELSKTVLRIVGISNLDLRRVKLPEDRDFFFNFFGTDICNVKLPYINTKYYFLKGIFFYKSIFTKPESEKGLEDFIWDIYKLSSHRCVYNVPAADYSKVSLYGMDLSETHFDKDCILPKDINFFQFVKRKDVSKTELPIDCLNNIHLYNLNDVKIDLSLYNWYKDVLTSSQLVLIQKKYPSQIGKTIILPE